MEIKRDAYSMTWYISKRVLLVTYHPVTITEEILRQLGDDLNQMSLEGIIPVHLISDSTNQGEIKVGLPGIRDCLAVMGNKRWGWITLVGMNRLTNFFSVVVANTFKLKVRPYETIEEAAASLAKLDFSLR